MLTLQNFTGINNVRPADQLTAADLTVGLNVDLDTEGRPRRRSGFTTADAAVHKNVWEAGAFTLATRGAGGDLVNVDDNVTLHAALGHAPRVWYCKLPDGRILYANGVSQGVVAADGSAAQSWGVPVPASTGAAANAAGLLHPGEYQWALTHVRLSDGAESGPIYSAGAVAVTTGGVALSALPTLAGYATRVYLSSHYGAERFYAGVTVTDAFAFAGANKDLALPCRTEFLRPPPAGKLLAFWRGRAIVAVGNALFASKPHSWELFDLQRDFKPFSAPITMVHPTDGGIWVGTEKELVFLAGSKWDDLARVLRMNGPVVLGSGVAVPGEHLRQGEGRAQGDCMVCIADGWLVAGMPDGGLVPLTVDRYRTAATEVSATFRVLETSGENIPQYIAIEQ